VHHVPVTAADNRHTADHEIFVDDIKVGGGARPAGGNDGGTGFAGKNGRTGIKHPVKNRQDPAA